MGNTLKVGITHGDINGINYEIIFKALSNPMMTELFTPVIFGSQTVAEEAVGSLSLEYLPDVFIADNAADAKSGKINIIEIAEAEPALTPGKPSEESGRLAVKALQEAVGALENGDIDVIVTAPISKYAVQGENFKFPGHTEFFGEMAGNEYKPLMILFDENIRIALVTTHLPVADIASAITKERILESLRLFNESLRKDFGIVRPKIAVLSLNPHCGDNGLLGKEESEIIIPTLEEAKKERILAFGPFPADGFFGQMRYKDFDGVLAMYHDQGLAPFKALAGNRGVNYTAGLPFVRTSPDHGTGFDIAWKGTADETSLREAIFNAIDIYRRREIYEKNASHPLKPYYSERTDRQNRQDRINRNDHPEHEADVADLADVKEDPIS